MASESAAPPPSNPATQRSSARSRAEDREAAARGRRRAERLRHRKRVEAAGARREAEAAAKKTAEPSSLLRIKSLAGTKSTDDAHPTILLLAAGAVLVLVMASGSLLSVATRMMKGQLR